MEYTLIRSARKSLSVTIDRNGDVIVRAPKRMPQVMIDRFLKEKETWIEAHRQKALSRPAVETLSDEEIRNLKKEARRLILPMMEEYAHYLNVSYKRISIRAQKTRWGSCSADGNLNFNCLLALAPEPVMRYVVIHELCHRIELNHSKAFWKAVADLCPDYKIYRKWLKNYGAALIARLP